MKRRLIAFALVSAAFLCGAASQARATEVGGSRTFGLGVAIGAPTGIVGKVWLGSMNALDFGLSFHGYGRCYDHNDHWIYCNQDRHLSINVDYLWEQPLARGQVRLNWHIGIGGRLWFYNPDANGSDLALGVRMPFGLDLTFNNPTFLEVFFELSPVFYVVPGVGLDIEPLIGVRFYF